LRRGELAKFAESTLMTNKESAGATHEAEPSKTGADDQLPAVDVYETDDGLVIVAELPGTSATDLDIQVEKGVLRILGKSADVGPADAHVLHRGFQTGRFSRRFALSDELDREHIQADLTDGVLTLTIPKADRAKPKRIVIRAG